MKSTLLRGIALLAIACVALAGNAAQRGFTIFVDSLSNSQISAELEAYAASVRKQGLVTETVVVGPSVTPDSIRAGIRSMATRKKAPIEGFVLVGEIPVPMLLDA